MSSWLVVRWRSKHGPPHFDMNKADLHLARPQSLNHGSATNDMGGLLLEFDRQARGSGPIAPEIRFAKRTASVVSDIAVASSLPFPSDAGGYRAKQIQPYFHPRVKGFLEIQMTDTRPVTKPLLGNTTVGNNDRIMNTEQL